VALQGLAGSGPGGRITEQDVRAAAAPAPVAPTTTQPPVPLSAMRRTIARRMTESLRESAQLTMHMDVIMDDAVRLREQLLSEWQDDGVRVTYTDLVLRAVARALPRHTAMNASFAGDGLVLHPQVHLGLAVALEEGLVVPVIRNADALDLRALARESARLAAAARRGSLGVDDFHGGTFTVSALGMYGVDAFTPILNAPEAGILGVNRIRDAVGWIQDAPVRRKVMTLSLTWDHRVLDGAPAAAFLAAVRDLLEAPYRLLV
jgi:pyruvate dehydrogenase E2 component (dihydrolipoamide acetyltransferase)